MYFSRKQKGNSSQSMQDFSHVEMSKPVGVPRIPRVNPTLDWQPANLEVTNSSSTEALVTKSQRDNKAVRLQLEHYSSSEWFHL